MLSLGFALVYVGLATVAVLCSYPPHYGDWVVLLYLFTFPATLLGFGVAFTEGVTKESVPLILLLQALTVLPFWLLAYLILSRWSRIRRW